MNISGIKEHLIVIGVFIAIGLAYFSPVLKGKVLAQHDVVQSKAMAKEITDRYYDEGKVTRWTGRMFSGMPADQIWSAYPNNIGGYVLRAFKWVFPRPLNVLLLYMIGIYILLISVGCSSWLSAIGALAFAFSTYNITIIEAGHLSKVKALALIGPILAGIWFVFKQKYWRGLALISIFLALQIRSNHVQITYYMVLVIAIWAIYELIMAVKNKSLPETIKAGLIILAAFIIGIIPNTSMLWSTYEYSKETIRGEQELSEKKIDGNGLDKDYALSWSYGKAETFSLIIPRFSGGASSEALDESSATYEALTDLGVQRRQASQFIKQMPTYWGAQPFTSGPAYFGAIIIFLAVLGLFVIKSPAKWWLLASFLFCLFLSWGKNLQWFYDIFWNTLPMFNKFRSPTMIIAVGNVSVIWLAIWGLKTISDDAIWKKWKKPFLQSLGVAGGFCLLMTLIGPSMFDFQGPKDEQFRQQMVQMSNSEAFGNAVLAGITDDRAAMMRSDALRSLVFIVLSGGLIILLLMQRIKAQVFAMIMSLLVLIDMWPIAANYLNKDDFVRETNRESMYNPTPADQVVLADKDEHFRVLNLAVNTFNDALPSYHYKTIGGYHAAKLKRYQDLIERHIRPEMGKLKNGFENTPVLNMLNTKYLVTSKSQDGVFKNDRCLGEAWFVDAFKYVENADKEIEALYGFNPKTTAVIDDDLKSYMEGFKPGNDPRRGIAFTAYQPDEISYTSRSSQEQFAVFSEVYYKGNEDWKAYIDGEETEFIRVNYVLRGMRIPAGEHKIVFKFKPRAYFMGETISLIGSILLILVTLGYFFKDRLPFGKKEVPVKSED